MVDPIGNKAGAVSDRRILPVATTVPVQAPRTASAGSEPAVAPAAATLAESMAAQPPVDSERVARIRRAVQEGRFPIYPTTIADRLLALKMEWNPND
jgi:negative regulator of flagellin synthesis FlgM